MSLNEMPQSDSTEDADLRCLTDYRRVQIKTYALQSLIGQISKGLGTSVTAEDFNCCHHLAEDATRETLEAQALLASIQEYAPSGQQGTEQKHNQRVMLHKLTGDLYITARVLEHVVQRFASDSITGGPGNGCADAHLRIQNVCKELADEQQRTGIDAVPMLAASCEDCGLYDLPAEGLLLRDVQVREQPSCSSNATVKLPAGLHITVLEVLHGDHKQGRYKWGRIREALGYTGCIVLRDGKYGISFVQCKSKGGSGGIEQYAIGEYILTRDAAVTEEVSHESKRKGVLLAGTRFSVLEVIAMSEAQRIRARMSGQGGIAGFVSLRVGDHIFARHVDDSSGAYTATEDDASKPAEIMSAPTADILEATQQFATNAISKMASNMSELNIMREVAKPSDAREETYTTGEYVLLRNAAVNEAAEFASNILVVLVAGTRITILEIISMAGEQRIRGRIMMPTGQPGFISICSADHVFARRVDTRADESGGGIRLGPDAADQTSAEPGNAAESRNFEAAQKFASNAFSFASREFGKLPDASKMPNLRNLPNLSKMPGLSKVADLGEALRKNAQDHIL